MKRFLSMLAVTLCLAATLAAVPYRLPAADSLPDGPRQWVEMLHRQQQYAQAHPEAAHHPTPRGRSVEPLLDSRWHQQEPFNLLCPPLWQGHCAAGCVAIATAQVMRYHRWPPHGYGSHSYTCILRNGRDTVYLSADFSQSVYDWPAMLGTYYSGSDSVAGMAAARLVSDVGISVDMMYGASSGAYTPDVLLALTTYFDYDPDMRLELRDFTPIEQWEQMIVDELDAGRPVIYSGRNSYIGHAFVIDGYNEEGYFHFNWGWGGEPNGYFPITMLNTDMLGIGTYEGGYNMRQAAIVGVRPATGTPAPAYHRGFCQALEPARLKVALGETVPVKLKWFGILGRDVDLSHATFALSLDEDGSAVSTRTFALGPNNTYNDSTLLLTPTAALPAGTHRLRLSYSVDGQRYEPVSLPVGYDHLLTLTVDGDSVLLQVPLLSGKLSLDSLQVLTQVYRDHFLPLRATVTNRDTAEYAGTVSFALRQDGITRCSSFDYKLDLLPGQSQTLDTRFYATADTGRYYLVALAGDGTAFGSPLPVTVLDGANDFSLRLTGPLSPQKTVMPREHVEASATITNVGAEPFVNVMHLHLLDDSSRVLYRDVVSPVVQINPGESRQVTFVTTFEQGDIDSTYLLHLRDPNERWVIKSWGDSVAFMVGDASGWVPGDANADGTVTVADANHVVMLLLTGADSIAALRIHADVSHDGLVTIADANFIVNLIMHADTQFLPSQAAAAEQRVKKRRFVADYQK